MVERFRCEHCSGVIEPTGGHDWVGPIPGPGERQKRYHLSLKFPECRAASGACGTAGTDGLMGGWEETPLDYPSGGWRLRRTGEDNPGGRWLAVVSRSGVRTPDGTWIAQRTAERVVEYPLSRWGDTAEATDGQVAMAAVTGLRDLEMTEGYSHPEWSPDGRYLGESLTIGDPDDHYMEEDFAYLIGLTEEQSRRVHALFLEAL